MMSAIYGITRAGFVWLTAITTLVAGLPLWVPKTSSADRIDAKQGW
jgi:hypothetical protein